MRAGLRRRDVKAHAIPRDVALVLRRVIDVRHVRFTKTASLWTPVLTCGHRLFEEWALDRIKVGGNVFCPQCTAEKRRANG